MKIRLIGLLLAAIGFAGLALLLRMAALDGAAEPGAAEFLPATLGLAALFAGLPLALLGPGALAPAPLPLRSRHAATGEVTEV